MMLAEWWFSSPLRPYTRLQKDLLYLFAYRTPDQEAGSFYFAHQADSKFQINFRLYQKPLIWVPTWSFSQELREKNHSKNIFAIAQNQKSDLQIYFYVLNF